MIEMIVLAKFCKRLAAIARQKNRSGSWAALGAVGWIGGEITGAIVGSRGDSDTTNLYATALLFAIVGAFLAYLIVKTLAPASIEQGLPTARVV